MYIDFMNDIVVVIKKDGSKDRSLPERFTRVQLEEAAKTFEGCAKA